MESVSISDVHWIKNLTASYLQNIRYHGLMEAEFKKDPPDGRFKLLEVKCKKLVAKFVSHEMRD
jgi:predicted ATP-grasp superfamily ATP-dependent carboligase